MDKFFNNRQISTFLSHYSIDHWPDIIEAFALYSIQAFFLQYPETNYPSTKELIQFFASKTESINEELVNIYVDLHKLDKRLRQVVRHKLPHEHSKNHSKSRSRTKGNNAPNASFEVDKKMQGNRIPVTTHHRRKDDQANSDYLLAKKEQGERKSRPQTEMKEYKEKSTRKNAETSKRNTSKENISNDTHSPRARRISRNCSALRENEYNLIKPATTTSSTRNKNFQTKNKSRETLSRRESIHSFNEKYELWVPDTNNMEKLITAHRIDPCERPNSDITGREPIKAFNKFTSLIKDHKLKYNYCQPERANSPLLTNNANLL